MRLRPISAQADVSDFWRPRLLVVLEPGELPPGLFRIRVRTRTPAYCTVSLRAGPAPPIVAHLSRTGSCAYTKVVNVPRRTERIELELEPATDADVLVNAEIEGTSVHRLAGDLRRWRRALSAPRSFVPKVRQVLSGRHALAFSDQPALCGDEVYTAWQHAFEGAAERIRIDVSLRALTAEPARLLAVTIVANGSSYQWCARPVRAEGIVPLIIACGSSISSDTRLWEEAAGRRMVQVQSPSMLMQQILAEARAVGATAFAFAEADAVWSDLAAKAIAIEMLGRPDCLAVTFDTDLIVAGRRSEPRFRPAWSPRYQAESDYVRGAVAFRANGRLAELAAKADIRSASALLALLSAEGAHAEQVRHVPRVLLHERRTAAAQPHAEGGSVPLRRQRPRVSVLMPTKTNATGLRCAAQSVLARECDRVELVVIDNGAASRKQRLELDRISLDPRVKLVRDDRPFNFSGLINAGRTVCSGEVMLLLNDDVRALGDTWLEDLVQIAIQPDVGCVGALLLYPSGRIQHAGIVPGMLGLAGHVMRHLLPTDRRAVELLSGTREVSAVTGACLAVRAEVFDEVGGFDEGLPVTLNDVDFCLRVRARGYSNLLAPHVRLVHEESSTRGTDAAPGQAERLQREAARFLARWGRTAASDPYYSPHLSPAREDVTVREI